MEKEKKNNKKITSASNKTTSKKAATSKKQTSAKKTVKAVPEEAKVSHKNKPTSKNSETKKQTVKPIKENVVLNKVDKKPVEVKKIETKNKKDETKKDIKLFLNSEVGTLIKIVLIVAAVILLFLLVTNIINSYKEKNTDSVTSNEIQYDEILVSNILNQKNSTYYVLVYDAEDLYYDTYKIYIDAYKNKENAMRFYTSILSSGFNRNYFSKEESNVLVSNVADLKFKGTTLVKVQNGAIVSAYEDSTSIIEHLRSI